MRQGKNDCFNYCICPAFYLKDKREKNLTLTVKNHLKYLPRFFPLVHPSPLNLGWFRKNPWFEEEVIPIFKILIRQKINA